MKSGDLVSYYDTIGRSYVYGIVLRKKHNGYQVLWFNDLKVSHGEIENKDGLRLINRC